MSAGAFYLILRAIRAYERRGLEARDRPLMDERLLRIEERLEAIGSDVDRLVESERRTADWLFGGAVAAPCMYARCHLCRRSLGANTVLQHMPVGRKLAFDPDRGRLWVVCPRCGEWNLTPMEIRWEAVEECQRRFESAEARVSAGGVGVAKLQGLELIRLGAALPDEIANWRYGTRLQRRTRRRRILFTALGVVGGIFVGGGYLLGLASGSLPVAGYLAVAGAVYGWKLRQSAGPMTALRFTDARGKQLRVPHWLVDRIFVATPQGPKKTGSPTVGVFLRVPPALARHGRRVSYERSEPDLRYSGDDALPVLRAALTRLNWEGASPRVIEAAVRDVGAAERKAATRSESGAPVAAWELLLRSVGYGLLCYKGAVDRLALEMAVTEEIERRALAGEAAELQDDADHASEVAHIADNMFVPQAITDWIERHRPKGTQRDACR